jgi:predicted DNA-binding transcriptional regulator AlpA
MSHPHAAQGLGELRLSPESIEALARRLAELLAAEPPGAHPRRLLTAAEVSEWWGVERSWVYAHASELGARRLGAGERPRLRFDPHEVDERLASLSAAPAIGSPRVAPGSRSTRFRGRAELWSQRKQSRPGDPQAPPATAPKQRPSAR